MLRKKLCCLLCCIAILCLTATSAFASGGYFDGSDQPGSISFDFSAYEPAVCSGSIDLRMVAVWDDEAKTLRLCEDYAELLSGTDELFDSKTAARLFVCAESAGLPAQKLEIGADGKACAQDLAHGVYLVSQTEAFEGYICMTPALISVPMEIAGEWVFDVEAAPKLETLVQETTPTETVPTTEPPPPWIPVTGQINWPIPLLLVGGSFLILLGLCLRKEKKHET